MTTSFDHHHGDPDPTAVITVGIVAAIVILAVLVFAVVLFQNAQALEDERKVLSTRSLTLAEEQTRQLAQINQYRYISEPDGVVTIPIDRAIELFVARVQADPRQASPYSATIQQTTTGPPAP